jgi:hypothetical protein
LDLNNVTIERVLSKIEAKTDFKFLFNRSDVDINKLVSVRAKQQTVENILNNIFRYVGFLSVTRQTNYNLFNKSERAKSLVINQQSEIKGGYRIVMGCQFLVLPLL